EELTAILECPKEVLYAHNLLLTFDSTQNAQIDPNPLRGCTTSLDRLDLESSIRSSQSALGSMHVDLPLSKPGAPSPKYIQNVSFRSGPADCAKFRVSTEPVLSDPLVCDGCKRPIHDQVYLCVGTKPWHMTCLQCHVCGKNLQWERTCFLRSGSVFCRAHYERMLYCLYCDERLQENDSIHKIDAFFAYHRDCLQCAHCSRLLQSGDAFILDGAAAYCVTKRTQTGHSRNASCWLQITRSESNLVHLAECGQTCAPNSDAVDESLSKQILNPIPDPVQRRIRTDSSGVMLRGSSASEQCTNAVEREIQELRISHPSTDLTDGKDCSSTSIASSTCEYSCPLDFLKSCIDSDLTPASDTVGFQPAVRHLLSPSGAPADSMLFSSSVKENQIDQLTPKQSDLLHESESSVDNPDFSTTTDNDFAAPHHEPCDGCDSSTGSVKRVSNSCGREKLTRDSKGKRIRTSFKHQQLQMMKAFFEITRNPDSKDLKQLSNKTGLSKRVLQVWFQNARAKYRRTQSVHFQSQLSENNSDNLRAIPSYQGSPLSSNGVFSQACSEIHGPGHPVDSVWSDSSQPSLSELENPFNLCTSNNDLLPSQSFMPQINISSSTVTSLSLSSSISLSTLTSTLSTPNILNTHTNSARSPSASCSNKPWILSPTSSESGFLDGISEASLLGNFDQLNTAHFYSYPPHTGTFLDRMSGFPTQGCSSLSASLDTTSSASPPGTFCSLDEFTDPTAACLLDSDTVRLTHISLQRTKQHCSSTGAR
ncbi:LIM/homeobox protein Lhx2, partial [Fasciola gigantica]